MTSSVVTLLVVVRDLEFSLVCLRLWVFGSVVRDLRDLFRDLMERELCVTSFGRMCVPLSGSLPLWFFVFLAGVAPFPV